MGGRERGGGSQRYDMMSSTHELGQYVPVGSNGPTRLAIGVSHNGKTSHVTIYVSSLTQKARCHMINISRQSSLFSASCNANKEFEYSLQTVVAYIASKQFEYSL